MLLEPKTGRFLRTVLQTSRPWIELRGQGQGLQNLSSRTASLIKMSSPTQNFEEKLEACLSMTNGVSVEKFYLFRQYWIFSPQSGQQKHK